MQEIWQYQTKLPMHLHFDQKSSSNFSCRYTSSNPKICMNSLFTLALLVIANIGNCLNN